MELYIYYIFILKEYLANIFGIHYPIEIVALIIIADYEEIKISCGSNITCLIRDKIYIFGNVQNKIIPCKDIKSISSSDHHIVALTYIPNKLYIWGDNNSDLLCLTDINNNLPRELILPSEIQSISCGVNYTLALSQSGKCYSWGLNFDGRLGLGDNVPKNSPQELILSNIIFINCGGFHSTALTKFNKCHTWGYNYSGQLGLGDNNTRYSPQELNLIGIASMSCGRAHTVALMNNIDNIYVWGYNNEGQLGLGDCINKNTPQKLIFPNVISISCGVYHTMALTKYGKLYIWGKTFSEQLNHQNMPQEFILHQPIKSIFSGESHNIVITSNNKIYVWGMNHFGQLGLGDNKTRFVPTELKL